jgi:hypothetical protein
VCLGEVVEGSVVGLIVAVVEVHNGNSVHLRYVCDGLWLCDLVAQSHEGIDVAESRSLGVEVQLVLQCVVGGDEGADD